MKNLLILLITVFSFQFINAQEYTKTEKYSIKSAIKTKQQEYETVTFDIITTEEYSRTVASLKIVDLDFLEDISITTLKKPDLENINEILKVDVNYSTCCVYTETHYFMVTDKNDFISLPPLENTYCEHTTSEIQYVFPSQANGKENIILKTEVSFSETFKIQNLEVLQSFVWNDDDFLTHNNINTY